MSIAKDNAIQRKTNLENAMGKIALELKQKEEQLEQLRYGWILNDQVLKDFATEEAIEKSKKEKENKPEEVKN